MEVVTENSVRNARNRVRGVGRVNLDPVYNHVGFNSLDTGTVSPGGVSPVIQKRGIQIRGAVERSASPWRRVGRMSPPPPGPPSSMGKQTSLQPLVSVYPSSV